jgi:hypothetical protein
MVLFRNKEFTEIKKNYGFHLRAKFLFLSKTTQIVTNIHKFICSFNKNLNIDLWFNKRWIYSHAKYLLPCILYFSCAKSNLFLCKIRKIKSINLLLYFFNIFLSEFRRLFLKSKTNLTISLRFYSPVPDVLLGWVFYDKNYKRAHPMIEFDRIQIRIPK